MTGVDAGRSRLHLRLTVNPTRHGVRPIGRVSNDGGTVLPFPDRFSGVVV
ncbi:hypothetical protein [Micromonospora sp. NPDC005254]